MISPENQPPIGLLLSGGLDSSVLLGHLLRQGCSVRPLYVRSGLRWEPEELRSIERYLTALASPRVQPLVVLELPLGDLYEGHWSITGHSVPDAASPDEAVHLPGRNALLVVKTALWCQLHGIRQLALGVLGSNPFADATAGFFDALEMALNCTSDGSLRLVRPFSAADKRQVMKLGHDLPLEHTFSCIAPREGLHCGQCNKCAERQNAFASIGVADPTPYATLTAKR